jgi:YVTN family beta-propeller protein
LSYFNEKEIQDFEKTRQNILNTLRYSYYSKLTEEETLKYTIFNRELTIKLIPDYKYFKIKKKIKFDSIDEIKLPDNKTIIDILENKNYFFGLNYDNNSVLVISKTKKKIVKEIPVGLNPKDFCFSEKKQYLYTANYEDYTISVISIKELKEIRKIKVSQKPYKIAVLSKQRILYISDKQTKLKICNIFNELPLINPDKYNKYLKYNEKVKEYSYFTDFVYDKSGKSELVTRKLKKNINKPINDEYTFNNNFNDAFIITDNKNTVFVFQYAGIYKFIIDSDYKIYHKGASSNILRNFKSPIISNDFSIICCDNKMYRTSDITKPFITIKDFFNKNIKYFGFIKNDNYVISNKFIYNLKKLKIEKEFISNIDFLKILHNDNILFYNKKNNVLQIIKFEDLLNEKYI